MMNCSSGETDGLKSHAFELIARPKFSVRANKVPSDLRLKMENIPEEGDQ